MGVYGGRANRDSVLALMAEGHLILTSATATPTVFRRFLPHRFFGGCKARTLALTATLAVAVTQMGS